MDFAAVFLSTEDKAMRFELEQTNGRPTSKRNDSALSGLLIRS
jgi:hypothetical protein